MTTYLLQSHLVKIERSAENQSFHGSKVGIWGYVTNHFLLCNLILEFSRVLNRQNLKPGGGLKDEANLIRTVTCQGGLKKN